MNSSLINESMWLAVRCMSGVFPCKCYPIFYFEVVGLFDYLNGFLNNAKMVNMYLYIYVLTSCHKLRVIYLFIYSYV